MNSFLFLFFFSNFVACKLMGWEENENGVVWNQMPKVTNKLRKKDTKIVKKIISGIKVRQIVLNFSSEGFLVAFPLAHYFRIFFAPNSLVPHSFFSPQSFIFCPVPHFTTHIYVLCVRVESELWWYIENRKSKVQSKKSCYLSSYQRFFSNWLRHAYLLIFHFICPGMFICANCDCGCITITTTISKWIFTIISTLCTSTRSTSKYRSC